MSVTIPLESLTKEELIEYIYDLKDQINKIESTNHSLKEKVDYSHKGFTKVKYEIERSIWMKDEGVQVKAINKTVVETLSILNM